MECVKAQGLITKYINNELQGEILEEFLKHIDVCEDCREELEIYYVIMKGMRQIDEDNVLDYNFHKAFEKEIEESKTSIAESSKRFIIKLLILELMILFLAFILVKDAADFDSNYASDIKTFNGKVID